MPNRKVHHFAIVFIATLATISSLRSWADDERAPDPAHTTIVTGRVVDADGNPVVNARVAVMAEHWARFERSIGLYSHNHLPITFKTTGPVRTDNEGRFRIDILVGPARPAWRAMVRAAAEGHGMVSVELVNGKPQQEVEIKLDRERVIRGRLVDTQGQPAAAARVMPIFEADFRITVETITATDPPPYANPLLPAVTTDDKGRFLIRGLGTEKTWIEISHDQFATQRMHAQPKPIDEPEVTPFSVVAANIVEGIVTYGKGGKPAAGAIVAALTGSYHAVQTTTDEKGRYSLKPFPGNSTSLIVFPPDGQPYIPSKKPLSFAQVSRIDNDVELERGILIRGRVDEKPSGQAVGQALVVYRRKDSLHPDWIGFALESTVTAKDGSFELAVPAGKGWLYVVGGPHDYVHVDAAASERERGETSRIRQYPDAFVPLDLEPDSEPVIVAATLKRGVTLRAKVLAADGKPASKFVAFSRSYIPTGVVLYQAGWEALECHDGELILPGCDPENGGTVYLYDRDNAQGTTVDFTGAQVAGPPLTFKLEPCGTAQVRAVDGSGKAVESHQPWLLIQLTPGTVFAFAATSGKGDPEAEGDWTLWANFDRERWYPNKTDADGRITYTALIPGAPYVIAHEGTLTTSEGKGLKTTEFRVKPGEVLTLPDIQSK